MSEEERDTSELDAQVDTVEEEPQAAEATPDYDPSEDPEDTSPDMVDEAADLEAELYAGKYGNVEDLEHGYRELQRKMSERDDYARFGQNVAPHWTEFQQWKAQQSAPQPEPEPEMPWNPPHDYSAVQRAIGLRGTEAWENLRADERAQAEEYVNYYDQKWNSWFTNPYGMMEELAQPYIHHAIQQHFGQFQAQMEASNFLNQHKDDLDGHLQELDQLLASGVPAEYAREIIVHRKAAKTEKSIADEKTALQIKKDRLRGRVTRGAQRSGGTPGAESVSAANRSFGDLLNEVAEKKGFNMDHVGRLGESAR